MSCDKCNKSQSTFRFSDVYFKQPYHDEHLADANKFPNGTFVNTREQKASVMRQLGIKECGDKYHGAR